MKLPTEFKGEIYFYYNTKYNYMGVRDSNDFLDAEHVLLGSTSVDVEFNNDDAVKGAVKAMKEQIKQVKKETIKKIEYLNGQINSLMAIEQRE